MASSFHGDFARLVPRNRVAQVLFSESIAYVDENDTFHLRFMERTHADLDRASSQSQEDSTDYDHPQDADNDDPRVAGIQNAGHYVFSFDRSRTPEFPHVGWRVGRGTSKVTTNRGVDLLLTKPGDALGKKIASVHLLLRFNFKSGFLVLSAETQKAVLEVKVGTTWERLTYKEERLIHQPATMLRAGVCEYELEYTVEEEHREAYFKKRDVFFEWISEYDRDQTFRRLPGDSGVLRGRYLEFGTQGYGTFGWISEGLDTRNGDPVAIKELRIKNQASRDEVLDEVKMGKDLCVSWLHDRSLKQLICFQDKRGLLPILDAWCEHGDPNGCGRTERYYIFMPHALSDLSGNFWTSCGVPKSNKMYWLRELLEGLATLHAMGVMHRDIRPQNMLVMSISPPRASICDYGKAVKAESSDYTAIGPILTCAPEVWRIPNYGPYTNKVDIWAFGYAIADILGYSVEKYPGADGFQGPNSRITRSRHAALVQMLQEHAERQADDAALVDLALKLLQWDPRVRWSAEQALNHECWAAVLEETEEEPPREEQLSRAKRVRVEPKRKLIV